MGASGDGERPADEADGGADGSPEEPQAPARRSVLPEEHWARARDGTNQEALEYMRQRSKAPGVAEGGSERNHYCMRCNGVIPLRYDSREAAAPGPPERCPHCGAELEGRVRAMFNWVETDSVPGSDLAALWPVLLGLLALAALAVWGLLALLG